MLAVTPRRMLPQRSGSHDTLNGSVKPVWLDAPESVLVAVGLPAVIAGVAVTVGNNGARATLAAALACRYCASACATFWFDTLTCSSSAFRAASSYSSHQRPFAYASPGCDCFHPADSASLKFTGGCSLNAGGETTDGCL